MGGEGLLEYYRASWGGSGKFYCDISRILPPLPPPMINNDQSLPSSSDLPQTRSHAISTDTLHENKKFQWNCFDLSLEMFSLNGVKKSAMVTRRKRRCT